MEVNVTNKVVVITGSSRGIGSMLVRGFAQEGAKVVINYLNDYKSAKNLYDEVKAYNSNCLLIQADVTEQSQVKKLCKLTIDAYGKIDILINNAGVCNDNLLFFMTQSQWNEVIDVNLNSVFLCSRIFAKEMMRVKRGKIINIASLKGQVGSEGQANYSASKAGIIGLTKALAKELGTFGISINAVCPGFIITDLNRNNARKIERAQGMSVLPIDTCMEDLIRFIIYISSDGFRGVSGQVFNLDSRIN